MFGWVFHIGRIIKVGYTLSRHDALTDLIKIFGERPKRFAKLSRVKLNNNGGEPETNLVNALQD
ncbi:MAG TPA: hypothetical protein P5227_05595, partial [Emcibacteraceae bacterium]|nr:hypothetical protein [Emcibacteraceae bacterium]